MRGIFWGRLLLALAAATLVTGSADAGSKCENTQWSYCGRSIDKCCPPERPYACINLKSTMHGRMQGSGPIVDVPRGWSGCVGPATAQSKATWAKSCQRWVLCNDQN